MTASITLQFPAGRYHATPWGRNVNEGAVEWPPSCWRLLRALYATWKDRAPHLSDDAVHRLLGRLAVAPEYVVPPTTSAHTRHYMPIDDGRTTKVIDAFVALDPAAGLVVRWDVELGDDEREALEELVGLLTYVGRAESVCIASVGHDAGLEGVTVRPVSAASDGAGEPVDLLVPESPLDIDKLVTTTRAVRKARLLRPPGASPVSYRVPEQAPLKPRVRAARRVQPTAIRFAMVSKSPPTRLAALAVGDVLRQAAVKRSPQSATVSGHVDQDGPRVGQHRHAHYLSFAADPGRGHLVLDTAVVWAPAGFEADDTLALARIGRLHGRQYLADFRSTIRLGVEAVGPVEEVAPELSAVSSSWESFTPFAPGRHWKRGSKEEFAVEAVQAELVYRGLPPARVSLVEPGRSRWPVAGGWVSFRRHRPSKERLRDAAWAFGMRLEFDEPVAGPIALGKSSHMGLGLFLPV